VRARGTVIVVEGYMDVIALAKAGLGHAVAPLGTAITEAQLGLLWQLADEPIVCLDSDEAGLRAGQRLIERALPLLRPGKSLRFALMPQGLDPDAALRKRGVDAVRRYFDETYPLMDFLWMREVATRQVDTPERRAALRERLVQLAKSMPDRELRRAFIEALDKQMERRFGRGHHRHMVEPVRISRQAESGVGAARLRSGRLLADPEGAVERELLGPIVVHPELLGEVEEELAAEEFAHPELEQLRRGIISWYGEHGDLDLGGLRSHLTEVGFASLVNQLAAVGPLTAWYCGPDVDRAEVLDGWRARLAQRRRFCQRRAVGRAVAEAAGVRAEEARTQALAFDRLINRVEREEKR
jgi:DNA primase